MPRLHIEHKITDLDTWLHAFASFASVRRGSGVIEERIWQPEGDPRYVVVDLEIESIPDAEQFRAFLFERVWSSPASAPALAAQPRAVILHQVAIGQEQRPGHASEIGGLITP